MNLVNVFINWQTLTLALVIYAVTEAMRRFVQSLWKNWKKSTFYTEFALWTAPVWNGAAIGYFMRSFPWPVDLISPSSRAVYCVAIGLFCSVVYNRVRKYVGIWTPGRS